MQKLDKKQLPQFVGLCVLSTGTFGYFGLRMITPSPAAAATRPAAKPAEPAATPAAKAAAPAGSPAATAEIAAPPPAPGMRDPFVVGYTDPKTAAPAAPPAFATPPHVGPAPGPQAASVQITNPQIHEQVAALPPAPVSGLTVPGFSAALPVPPAAPVLPSQKIMPLPAPPPAPPKWSVTGLLQGEDGAGVAILRDGDSRRIVHVGDFLDNVFRVTRVTRSAVVLRHGVTVYTLSLGTRTEGNPAAKLDANKLDAKPRAIPEAPAAPPTAAPMPAVPALPRQSEAAPVPARRLTTAAVAAALPLRLLDGTDMAAGAVPEQKVASVIR